MYDIILATGGYDHSIKFWDINSGLCKRSINYPDSHINRLVVTPDRKYLGVAAYNIVKVYEIFSQENESTFDG
jgi:G protein beta subunit-like protein